MKRIFLISTVALALSGCGNREMSGLPMGNVVSKGRIATQSEFVGTLSGRILLAGGGSYVKYSPDGYLWGEVGGRPFGGQWEWRNGQQCQTSSPPIALGCQRWSVDGNIARAEGGGDANATFVIYD